MVTNVANFGAFVDIGVHQDGLVHISMLSQQFVKDPREVVKAGDIVRVKVLEVDIPRQRISLSMRLGAEVTATSSAGRVGSPAGDSAKARTAARQSGKSAGSSAPPGATLGALFANAKNLKKR